PDTGVYNAMNKGINLANGRFVCFMNAGDTFSDSETLENVKETLLKNKLDGLLGWGGLYGQVWASWAEHRAFKLGSLGFCHQSLYVDSGILKQNLFDERKEKTDSDTLQIGRLFEKNTNIKITPKILAIRGPEPGISADLEKSRASIFSTTLEEYPDLSPVEVNEIIDFRRECKNYKAIENILNSNRHPLVEDLSYVVMDTLFLRQSKILNSQTVESLYKQCKRIISNANKSHLDSLVYAQKIRASILKANGVAKKALEKEIEEFSKQEQQRLARSTINTVTSVPFIVSLTSFPVRLPTVHFVIQSLLSQTCKPAEIHLWLGENEVPNINWLPTELLRLREHGLKINFSKKTFHQYDKFMHNAEINKSLPFVIVDDDVIYKPNSMQLLLEKHDIYKNSVVANRCHRMEIDGVNNLKKYADWKREVEFYHPSFSAFPTGAGGVLYPVGYLSDSESIESANILKFAPYADDVWLKFLGLLRDIPVCSTSLSASTDWYHRYTPTMKQGALHATNVDLGLNDMQITRCCNWLSDSGVNWKSKISESNLV
ncbi:MAG: hypothetical protein ORN50_04595, partial [Crocinitomicaceae bacterium]|nr:hypothetical protein [Crocinitomicaceae bacterium]